MSNIVNLEIFLMMFFSKISKVFCQNLIMKKNVSISSLKETVNRTLEKHAPFIKIYVIADQIIMKRSRLRNNFLNTKSEADRRAYKEQ